MTNDNSGEITDIKFLYHSPFTNGGPAYTCSELAHTMAGQGSRTHIYVPLDRRVDRGLPVEVCSALPRAFNCLPFRVTRAIATHRSEQAFLKDCDDGRSIAFLWGETTLGLARVLAERGIPTVREKINCGKAVAGDILRKAYAGLNALEAFDTQPIARLDKEEQELALAQYIFCPSPMVRETLRTIGIDDEKMIDTSYGYDPSRIGGNAHALVPIAGPTFLFVGSVCVGKGAHILLDAWQRSNVKGRLVLLGVMEPLIRRRYAQVLARADVEHYDFNHDVGSFYRSADFFVFPSLAEGGPQVTYEAAASGLPSIVSRMGAGAIVRDGIEGVVEPSSSVEAWIEQLRAADSTTEAYQDQSRAAVSRAKQFTWRRVGQQRRKQLLARLV